MSSSRIPYIASVVPNDWNSVMRFCRDVQKYMSVLSKSDETVYMSDLYLSGLTASRLIATDASKKLVSTGSASWISGTTNQVTVTDDGDGTATLSTPQDLDVDADFEIGSLTIRDNFDNITFYADDSEFYISLSSTVPVTGNPIGLLLALTYNLD